MGESQTTRKRACVVGGRLQNESVTKRKESAQSRGKEDFKYDRKWEAAVWPCPLTHHSHTIAHKEKTASIFSSKSDQNIEFSVGERQRQRPRWPTYTQYTPRYGDLVCTRTWVRN